MITISPMSGEYSNGFVINGHAEYAVTGKDIVCSAVSALSQSCLLSLKRYDQVEQYVESGNMRVKVSVPSIYTNLLINSMVLGLQAIQERYPKHVYIESENKQVKGQNLHEENAWI